MIFYSVHKNSEFTTHYCLGATLSFNLAIEKVIGLIQKDTASNYTFIGYHIEKTDYTKDDPTTDKICFSPHEVSGVIITLSPEDPDILKTITEYTYPFNVSFSGLKNV